MSTTTTTTTSFDESLSTLNKQQREAVETCAPQVVIYAGPGTGKTRVITHRIGYLVKKQNINPPSIWAVTFSNRAAREMKERINELCGDCKIVVGTFHAICNKILKRDANLLGLAKNFTICTAKEQEKIMSEIMQQLKIEEVSVRDLLWQISVAKNKSKTPDTYKKEAKKSTKSWEIDMVAPAYENYELELRERNMVDFDDLLFKCKQLFESFPSIRKKYTQRISHLLIDEYQDTNEMQFRIANYLGTGNNIFIVGDPDQTIYTWRFANSKNLKMFYREYPDAQKIQLKINYRSTNPIIHSACTLLEVSDRVKRKLLSVSGSGENIHFQECQDPSEEAEWVGNTVLSLNNNFKKNFGDIAILARTNLMLRSFEEHFSNIGIPYQMVSVSSFYDQIDVQQLLIFLKFLDRKNDFTLFNAAIHIPEQTYISYDIMDYIDQLVKEDPQKNCIDAAEMVLHQSQTSHQELLEFVNVIRDIEEFRNSNSNVTISSLLSFIVTKLNYEHYIRESDSENFQDRFDNIKELCSVASEFKSLSEFISETAVQSDNPSETPPQHSVVLTTLHSAKGLEWPIVFLPGLEDGFMPHVRAQTTKQQAEERRLLFVGMTRAKTKLYLSSCRTRMKSEEYVPSERSPFLSCLLSKCKSHIDVHKTPEISNLHDSSEPLIPPDPYDYYDEGVSIDKPIQAMRRKKAPNRLQSQSQSQESCTDSIDTSSTSLEYEDELIFNTASQSSLSDYEGFAPASSLLSNLYSDLNDSQVTLQSETWETDSSSQSSGFSPASTLLRSRDKRSRNLNENQEHLNNVSPPKKRKVNCET